MSDWSQRSVYSYIPFFDRLVYLYESFDAEKIRLHNEKVGVMLFRTELSADACAKFIRQFNCVPGLRFIRVTKNKRALALIDVRKVMGKWNFK